MRTSLNEIRETESFLLCTMPDDEAILYRAKIILQPELRQNTSMLQKTLSIVKSIGRNKLLCQIQKAERTLFHQQEFREFQNEVADIFLKQ